MYYDEIRDIVILKMHYMADVQLYINVYNRQMCCSIATK